MNAWLWRLLRFFALTLWALCGLAAGQPAPAFSPNVVHAETMQVGPHRVSVQFTASWPPRAQKSFDLIFAPDTGIKHLQGSWKLLGPNGAEVDSGDLLPHYPRDRHYWGLDATGFTTPGRNTFVLTIGRSTGTLAVQVGPAPAGPPRPLISALALLPILAVLVLTVRAWRQVRPLRQVESRTL